LARTGASVLDAGAIPHAFEHLCHGVVASDQDRR
jgi:hypothetical protein